MTKINEVRAFDPKVIRTAALILRPIELTDLDAYFDLYSDADVMRGWGTHPHTSKEETQKLIQGLRDQMAAGDLIRWAIAEKQDPSRLLGDVGYWRFVKVRHRGELGAKLSKACWKKGWMTQALSAVIHYGFTEMGLHSVEGNIDPKNIGSIRLVEKIGFERIGVVKEHSYDPFENRYLDTVLFSLTKPDWKGFECTISSA